MAVFACVHPSFDDEDDDDDTWVSLSGRVPRPCLCPSKSPITHTDWKNTHSKVQLGSLQQTREVTGRPISSLPRGHVVSQYRSVLMNSSDSAYCLSEENTWQTCCCLGLLASYTQLHTQKRIHKHTQMCTEPHTHSHTHTQ